MTTKNNWKDDFDKRFASMYLIADERIIELNHNLLKGFISNLLAEQKKELLDEIKRYQPSISKELDTYLLQKAQDDVSLKRHE